MAKVEAEQPVGSEAWNVGIRNLIYTGVYWRKVLGISALLNKWVLFSELLLIFQ